MTVKFKLNSFVISVINITKINYLGRDKSLFGSFTGLVGKEDKKSCDKILNIRKTIILVTKNVSRIVSINNNF